MSIHDDLKTAERQLEKVKMRIAKNGNDAASDTHTIKENVVGLARDLKDNSVNSAHSAVDYVREQMSGLRTSGIDTLEKVEDRIQTRPVQSLAIAFTVGLLTSFLFARRSS